jgi:hypothetical protein
MGGDGAGELGGHTGVGSVRKVAEAHHPAAGMTDHGGKQLPTQDVSFMCNALIAGREAMRPLQPFTLPVGNWIRGTVVLRDDALSFSTNKVFAIHQQNASDLVILYGDITSCRLGRLAVFLKTVDLETTRGPVRFRTLIKWNETLLAELQKRMDQEKSV